MNSEKQYECDDCFKSFTRKDHLRNHVITIHGEGNKKPCEICGSLISKNNMNAHIKTHQGTKDYQCDLCQKAFSTNQSTHG